MKLHALALAAAGAMLFSASAPARGAERATPAAGGVAAAPWTFYASGFAYFVPDDRDYLSPIFTADRSALHLEARYNYEGFETGSFFVGWIISTGEKVTFDLTPMVGAVFGDQSGVAPGFRVTLGYKNFELYSEGEYMIDVRDSSENYFYSWSELGWAPNDWSRVGLAGQRTRAYQSELDFQRGLMAGFFHGNVDCTAYLFNLGWTDPTVVIAVGLGFGG